MPVQHGEQHRQALRIEADGQSAWVAVRLVDQRLDLDQQRSRAFCVTTQEPGTSCP